MLSKILVKVSDFYEKKKKIAYNDVIFVFALPVNNSTCLLWMVL